MKMIEEQREDVLVLILQGELMGGDEGNEIQERVYKAIEAGTVSIVADMKGIKWMNSAGLGLLMAGMTTLRGSGGDLRLADVSDRVKRPIEITKLDRVITIFETVDEAVKSFASGG